ncbi:MAG: ferrous iron transport protein B [Clostridia bacterium]|nr:ferrous iron transport protein B [Clostridia bacterium]
MGLSGSSVGRNLLKEVTDIKSNSNDRKVIALAGNPNVGKSSLFNLITKLHQHTGNWPGKTVQVAVGNAVHNGNNYVFVDLPGCYSLFSRSPEEDVARDFIESNIADVTIIVCDATALERNLTLAMQIKELTPNVILCVNLLDEAKKKNISIDLDTLSIQLNCPVIGTVAHKSDSIDKIFDALEKYSPPSTDEKSDINEIKKAPDNPEAQKSTTENTEEYINIISQKAAEITSLAVKEKTENTTDLKIDKIITNRYLSFVIIFFLLITVFWITVAGANYPSRLLSHLFSSAEKPLYNLMYSLKIPKTICDMTVYGVYHILTWIISVMLPPMAIFFPLFTLLEDIGFLPRIAFNLDKCFQKCSTCGKQALTTCMGFGCNAAGVIGCRIIDTPRERMIAILTNSFIPCNGRFPVIISLITLFFISDSFIGSSSILPAVILALFIVLSISASLLVSKLLSKTILKGLPSSFTLELPPYRRPQISKIIIRSIFDRTLFVLGRAITVAAPAGLIIWVASNTTINGLSILEHIADFLDPLGRIMGLDGIILTAFILGFPANEIVFPLILMMYSSSGILSETGNLFAVKQILISNGWTFVTALNTIIFMLFHWPCSTTCLTVKSETKSVKWTLVAFALPTLFGILLCSLINLISNILL